MEARLKEREAQWCSENSVKQSKPLPPEAASWDDFECDLWFRSKGLFHPRREIAKHQRRGPPATVSQGETIRDLLQSSTDYRVPDDPKGRPGRVSVVCPTIESRQQFHPSLYLAFDSQTWSDKELIIIETYQSYPSKFFFDKAKHDPRVIHVHFRRPLPMKMRHMKLVKDGGGGKDEEQPLLKVPSCTRGDFSIGFKRNLGTYLSSGEFIAHFDDDDLYAPSYVRSMVNSLRAADAMAVKFSSWFVFNLLTGSVFECDPVKQGAGKKALYGYGFSYVYRRSAALASPFQDIDRGEDYGFYSTLLRKYGEASVATSRDTFGRCLHIQHGGNLTESFPFRELKEAEACGSYEFTACAGFDHYMCWVSTNEALMSFVQASPEETQEEFLYAMKGKAPPSKDLAASLNLSHQELREIIIGFKQGFDGKGDGKTEEQNASADAVADGLGEWSALAESQHLKTGDRVKVRWPIYTDDESGRTLLRSGLRGDVVKVHGNGDITVVLQTLAAGEATTGKRIKKKQFHRLMVWCAQYLAGFSTYDALEYDPAEVSSEPVEAADKGFSASVRDIVCR